jgi:hypothetical protein
MAKSGDRRTPGSEDAATESAVLQQVLDLYPTQVTFAELLREVGGQFADFSERDAIERAVRDLVGAGLLHRNDEFILPSRAALRFNELLDL